MALQGRQGFYDALGTHHDVEVILSEAMYKRAKGTLRKTPSAYFTGAVKPLAKEKGIKL